MRMVVEQLFIGSLTETRRRIPTPPWRAGPSAAPPEPAPPDAPTSARVAYRRVHDFMRDEYRPQISGDSSEEELFDVLTRMLSHLDDNHVMLRATSLGKDFNAGNLGPYIADLGLDGALARRAASEMWTAAAAGAGVGGQVERAAS